MFKVPEVNFPAMSAISFIGRLIALERAEAINIHKTNITTNKKINKITAFLKVMEALVLNFKALFNAKSTIF